MIEINLLPGARKSKRSRSAAIDVRAMLGDLTARIRDPWLISCAVGVALGLGATGFMWWRTDARDKALTQDQQKAVQDSTQFASVIGERTLAEAQRDSVTRQLAIIRSIDGTRFIWPHVLDEVNRALTPYTWIRQLNQTSAVPAVPPEVEAGVASPAAGKSAAAKQAEADEAAAASTVTLRIIGCCSAVSSHFEFPHPHECHW